MSGLTNDEILDAIGRERWRFQDAVAAEVRRARAKFPGRKHMLPALMEEVGELANALIEHDLDPRRSSPQQIYDEAVQVAAMAQRIAEEGDAAFSYDPAAVTPPQPGRRAMPRHVTT